MMRDGGIYVTQFSYRRAGNLSPLGGMGIAPQSHMAELTTNMPLRLLLQRGLGAPLLLLAVLAMVVLPLPPLALDVLFTFNIALSVLVVMAVVNVSRPLDFGIFPTVLLLATLLRLALNVASTRVVLLHGHEGTAAAGHVIEAFGQS